MDELTLGDNDNLTAIVAALVDADLLLIATDIDGLYTADPRGSPGARPINIVEELTSDIMAMGGSGGSSLGTGGMRTKLKAAQKAAAAGIDTLLFNGRDSEVSRVLSRDLLRDTRLCSGSSRLHARKYWLRQTPTAHGLCVSMPVLRTGSARNARRCRPRASLLPKVNSGAATWSR